MDCDMATEECEGIDVPVLDHEKVERGTDIVGVGDQTVAKITNIFRQ